MQQDFKHYVWLLQYFSKKWKKRGQNYIYYGDFILVAIVTLVLLLQFEEEETDYGQS